MSAFRLLPMPPVAHKRVWPVFVLQFVPPPAYAKPSSPTGIAPAKS